MVDNEILALYGIRITLYTLFVSVSRKHCDHLTSKDVHPDSRNPCSVYRLNIFMLIFHIFLFYVRTNSCRHLGYGWSVNRLKSPSK